MNPLVSIIIPVYNVEKYLIRCLMSVVNQTYKNIEIICVNDGSTDSSQSILKKFAKRDIRIQVINQENQGLSSARNKGLESAKGEYVIFLDSDDYYELNTIKDNIVFLEDSDVDYVNFGINFCGDITEKKRERANNSCKTNFSGVNKLSNEIILSTPVYVGNKIFKKSLIDKYNLRFIEGLYFEDAAFTYSYLSAANKGFYSNTPYYNYFQRENSIMFNLNNKKNRDKKSKICRIGMDHINIAYEYFNFLDRHNLFQKNRELFKKIFVHYAMLAIKYSPEYLSEIKSEVSEKAEFILEKYPQNISEELKILSEGKLEKIKELKYQKTLVKQYMKNLYRNIMTILFDIRKHVQMKSRNEMEI